MQTNTISAFLAATAPEKDPVIPTDHFSRVVSEYLPDGVSLPPALVKTFNWLERQGCYHVLEDGENPEDYILSIYPLDDDNAAENASMVAFHPEVSAFTQDWPVPDPRIDAQIITLATTSTNGARAVMWIDDNGKKWFAHLGRDTLGLISDNPLVMLQFLAMGYREPGQLTTTDVSPLQEALQYHNIADTPGADAPFVDVAETVPPLALQTFLKREFKLSIPETARDLGIADFTQFGDPDSTDPFANWIASLLAPPAPVQPALAPTPELNETVSKPPEPMVEPDPLAPSQGLLGTVKGWFAR